MFETNKLQSGEKGNVLFLILIAVALFAALSYAVTQSSRSGGGDANNETNLISSAEVTQYPASVRTSIIRMMVSNNVAVEELEFNTPSDFSNCTSNAVCVFHPAGGGATYVTGSADVARTGSPQAWVFNSENEVNLVGSTDGGGSPSATTAEIIAFLPDVKKSICDRLNTELGIGAVPAETGVDVATQMTDAAPGIGAGGGRIGGGGAAALDGKAFGCFYVAGTPDIYYYYHVLIEQ